MLLHVRSLSKTFGAADVLRDVSLVVNRGERIGLVGANGAGKTTLLRIVTGGEAADAGTVTFAPDAEVGYLPQTTPDFHGATLDDLIRESVGGLRGMESRMRTIEAELAVAGGDGAEDADRRVQALLDEYGHLATRFQDRGGYELDHRIAAVLAGLRLDYLPRTREVSSLSGGERARVGVAALLLRSPDLLLLDEPTNHLDVASLEWLEGYLAAYDGAALIVSHDRQFLNRTVTVICEIDDLTRGLVRYEGDYDAYARAKAAARADWEMQYQRQQDEIKELRRRIREAATHVGHNRAPTDNDKTSYNFFGERVQRTVGRTVRSAQEELARIEADPIEKPPKPLGFEVHLYGERLHGRAVVRAEGVTKSLGGRGILRGVTLDVEPGARILLAGPNGAGKTTLIKLLLGIEAPDEGTVRTTPGLRFGYLPQDPAPIDPDRTLYEAYSDGLVGYEGTLVASLLGNGLFRLEDLSKRVGYLSMGQRRKLELARLVAARPHVLVLDEPTNYISLDVLELFEAAVLAFAGPVIAVSHDRWFMDRFSRAGGVIWRLSEGLLARDDL
ncbi:MAG: ribosomal protection-like ABC-F family protein [Ktedonobacterales bacterium]